MGQRPVSPAARRSPRRASDSRVDPTSLALFPTDLGWFGLRGAGDRVIGLSIGHQSADEVRSAVETRFAAAATPIEADWNPRLRRMLQDFARGVPTEFRQIEIDLGMITGFRERTLQAVRRIPYAATLTYGELAVRIGHANAARAVGSAMAANPLPILIPCHRVVGSGGSIGGFSGPHGIELKRRLLEMEAAAAERSRKPNRGSDCHIL
jgi:methylated-DNA-[protein]-cysteine S-methyltransferase